MIDCSAMTPTLLLISIREIWMISLARMVMSGYIDVARMIMSGYIDVGLE